MKRILSKGVEYAFKKDISYPESTRSSDLKAAIKRGNNASAKIPENFQALQKSYTNEVHKGWMIPFLREDVEKIPNAGVIPAGVATQWTISNKGDRILKRRTTHDASRPGPSGLSVNIMCDKDLLDENLIGFCLLRI